MTYEYQLVIYLILSSWLLFCMTSSNEHKDFLIRFEEILKDYDRKAIPSRNGEPINVSLQLHISDMVSVKPKNMHFSVQMYFRQFWIDYQLADAAYPKDVKNINDSAKTTLSWQFASMIWTPDIFFSREKEGERVNLVLPNILIRVGTDGSVFFSQNLRVSVFCNMNLKSYPFDRQQCVFPMESYAYPNYRLRLQWNTELGGPIFPPINKQMGEYTFDKYEYSSKVVNYGGKMLTYDVLSVTFHFRRNITPFILKMYMPCILLVMLSWISFWIDYQSTPARVTLGITSVLTMATLGSSIRESVPVVSYMKAIDVYVIICFFYVIAALIEYIFVGITDMRLQRIIKEENVIESNLNKSINLKNVSYNNQGFKDDSDDGNCENEIKDSSPSPMYNNNENSYNRSQFRKRTGVTFAPDTTILEGTHKRANKLRSRSSVVKKLLKEQRRDTQIHYVDRISRYVFPLTFLVTNIIYFSVYILN